jgi:adenylate cyclase
MGDSVNLGSRLEGLNKVYGTNIIASEMAYERVREEILGRELDSVRVKGKDQPVKIYELLTRRIQASVDQKALTEKFHSARAEYRQGNWDKGLAAFQCILDKDPNDGPAKLYVERCAVLKKNPPPEDWDGVYTMTTK